MKTYAAASKSTTVNLYRLADCLAAYFIVCRVNYR